MIAPNPTTIETGFGGGELELGPASSGLEADFEQADLVYFAVTTHTFEEDDDLSSWARSLMRGTVHLTKDAWLQVRAEADRILGVES
jgi:hypothetical protein